MAHMALPTVIDWLTCGGSLCNRAALVLSTSPCLMTAWVDSWLFQLDFCLNALGNPETSTSILKMLSAAKLLSPLVVDDEEVITIVLDVLNVLDSAGLLSEFLTYLTQFPPQSRKLIERLSAFLSVIEPSADAKVAIAWIMTNICSQTDALWWKNARCVVKMLGIDTLDWPLQEKVMDESAILGEEEAKQVLDEIQKILHSSE
jgi:hypothetical protein